MERNATFGMPTAKLWDNNFVRSAKTDIIGKELTATKALKTAKGLSFEEQCALRALRAFCWWKGNSVREN